MEENKKRKVYDRVGSTKRLNINVVLDDENVYSGISDDAPENIKKLWYSEVEMGNPMTFVAYSDCN